MKCNVACECEKLTGTAELIVTTKLEPKLTYELSGKFRVEKKLGVLHPVCSRCDTAPMTTGGGWKS